MKGRAYMASVTRDLTEGIPTKLILSFGIPLLFGFLFQQFYNVADTAIVGRFLGGDALAAVGSTGSVNFLVIGFVIGHMQWLRNTRFPDVRRRRLQAAEEICFRLAVA